MVDSADWCGVGSNPTWAWILAWMSPCVHFHSIFGQRAITLAPLLAPFSQCAARCSRHTSSRREVLRIRASPVVPVTTSTVHWAIPMTCIAHATPWHVDFTLKPDLNSSIPYPTLCLSWPFLRRLRSEFSVDNLDPLNAHPGGFWVAH